MPAAGELPHAQCRLYYGWVLAGALAVTETVSYGVLAYAFGVLLVPMQQSLGWSLGTLTAGYSLAMVVSGLAAIPVGRWLDRHGARTLMTVGSILATVLVLALAGVQTPWAYQLLWAGLGITMAMVLYEPAMAVLAVWFCRQRARALLLLTVVAGFSSVIFLPLTDWLVDQHGWRGALVVLAVVLGVVTIPPHGLLLRRHPADLGLHPDGHPTPPPTPTPTSPTADHAASHEAVPLREAARGPVLWWLAAGFGLATLAVTTVSVHLVAYLRETGHDPRAAATWTGLLGVMSVTGRLLVTALGRRIPLALATAGIFALQAVAVVVLLAGRSPLVLPVFVGLFGIGVGLISLTRATLVADYYGSVHYASINGLLAALLTGARALAPVSAGLLRTQTGSYQPVMRTVALVSLLAALAMVQAYRTARSRAHPTLAPRARPHAYRR